MTCDACPAAPAANIVEFGKARFTFLTDRMVRLEWAADGCFEDRLSLAVANRAMAPVDFKRSERGGQLTLSTAALKITYTGEGRKFSRSNLKIAFKAGGVSGTWSPGQRDAGNLKGTGRTLDCFDGDRDHFTGKKLPLCDGLVSRSGWAFFDDSGSVVLDPALADQPWAASRPAGARQDFYFMAYGLDFKAALHDTARVFGRQPLPPRFVLGYWWSRYWEYNDKELEELVSNFDRFGLPLDVLVIDMDWHKEGWTGYSWDRRYFPDPDEFLGWLKDQDLKITLNLHPADGVARHEDRFEAMARAVGANPKKTETIEFDCTDPNFVDAYFKVLHHPQEDAGVDFWWMDWQQGESTKLPGLDPLSWLNHLHYEDMARRTPGRRPLIFSRFGGLGAGRYPVGFSGDTVVGWKSLAYQPYFTATASNVHYGYWSHDIGGHHLGELNGELYLRWVQYGIFSPVLRTHTTKNFASERKMWEYPKPWSNFMIEAVQRRYEMVPYIYSECRRAYDTGLSLCRPMYYDHPREDAAYDCPAQYMFGESMLVAPVTAPASEKDEMAAVKVWLPRGRWFDAARGVWERGGDWITRRYMAREIPVFVQPGAIVPGQRVPRRLRPGAYKDLVVTAYPGGDGSYELYEDDGVSQAWRQSEASATIPLAQKQTRGGRRVTIGPAVGAYEGYAAKRTLELRLPAVGALKRVTVNGRELPFAYRLGEEGWAWSPELGGVLIRVGEIDLGGETRIEVACEGNAEAALGMAGAFNRLERIRQLGSYLAVMRATHELSRAHADALAATTRAAMNPNTLASKKKHIKMLLEKMPQALKWRLKHARREELKDLANRAIRIARELAEWF